MDDKNNPDWKPIPVSLPVRYWIAVLACVDYQIQHFVKPKLEELRAQKRKPEDLPDEVQAALMGPLFARGEIIKVLHEAGVITPEANKAMGTDSLLEMARRYNRRKN